MTAVDRYGKLILRALDSRPITPKRLQHIIKLPHLLNSPAHAIADVWRQLHEQKPFHMSMTMSKRHFEDWIGRAKVHPRFVVPVINGHQIDNYFIEHRFSEDTVVEIGCCPLQEYKTKQAFAQPALTVFAYSELLREKDIALLAGSFRPESSLDRASSQVLLVSTSEVYCRLYEFVQQFSCSPAQFAYPSYLSAFKDMLQHVVRK